MSDQTKSRFAIDLDDLERQLRQTATAQPKAASADPLAELARIVGRDDPYKAVFAQSAPAGRGDDAAPAPSAAARREPSLDDLLAEARPARAAPAAVSAPAAALPAAAAPNRDMIDEFDKLLRDELRGAIQPAPAVSRRPVEAAPAVPVVMPAPVPVQAPRPSLRAVDPVERAAAPRDLDDPAEGRGGARLSREAARDMDEQPAADYPEPPVEPPQDLRSLEARQPRKGLVMAAALMGVAVLGIGAVIGVGVTGRGSAPSGEPPLVRAEPGPNRVQPQNPGGVEIPNQNKEILERREDARPADTRVVNREEQPLDVQAAARAAVPSRVILPPLNPAPSNGAGASPPANGVTALAPTTPTPAAGQTDAAAPAAGLGEPRRVRTVSVRPDGTIAPPNGPAAVAPAPQATGSAPPAAPPTPVRATPVATPPAAAAPPRPVTRPAAEELAPTARPATPRPAERPQAERSQVAAAPASAAVPQGNGFMVQLAAPGSESEARATFSSLQRRFSDQLSGETPTIRRAEANGRTVYRVRIGPFSREEAVEKCEALRASGGQCFIAR